MLKIRSKITVQRIRQGAASAITATLLLSGTVFTDTLKATTEVPINIGIGPAKFMVPERLGEDPKPFFGLRLHIKAIVNKELLKKNKSKIPAKFQKPLSKIDEVRVGFILIPESIMLGWRTVPRGPEFWGATWRPIAMNVPIKMGPVKLSLGLGIIGTYAYVNTGDYKIPDVTKEETEADIQAKIAAGEMTYVNQSTNFFRPGADVNADVEIAFSDSFLMSFGWASAYYVPQKIGGGIFDLGEKASHTLFRIHQAYAVIHYRIPYKANL